MNLNIAHGEICVPTRRPNNIARLKQSSKRLLVYQDDIVSRMRLGMQMMYIKVKIKIICKMGTFIHALKCTTQVPKSSKKIRNSAHA